MMGAPADFHQRELTVRAVDVGSLIRIHHASYDPIYYGTSGTCRFDAPDGSFGVLYAAENLGVAIAETLVREKHRARRNTQELVIPEALFRQYRVATLEADSQLALGDLTGFSLLSLGGDASELQADSYGVTQPWSARVHSHPGGVDGFIYQSRYVNSHTAAVIFERGGGRVALRCRGSIPLVEAPGLEAVLDAMKVILL